MAAGGRRPAKLTASRNITSIPSMTRPRRRPAASVRRYRRNIRPSVKGGDPAAHFNQTGPAGKHQYSPVHSGPPAMSRLPAGRAKRTKNPPPAGILPVAPPTPPPDLPASMGRKTAALQAAYPAEAVALPEVGAGDFPRIPRGVEASLAWVLPAVEVSPRIHLKAAVLVVRAQKLIRPVAAVPSGVGPAVRPGVAVSAAASLRRAHRAAHRKAPPPGAAVLAAVPVGVVSAAQVRKQIRLVAAGLSGDAPAVQPERAALVVHLPESRKKRKCLRPAPQEQGRPHPLADLGSGQPAPSPAQQEWAPAAPSGLPPLNPSTAGIARRLQLCLRLERRAPARHSRNTARFPGRTSLR